MGTTLDERAWQARAAAHAARVDAWTAGHRERAAERRAHPVEDFLFTYYAQRPAQLRRWHPGPGVVLLGSRDALRERLRWRWHAAVPAPAPASDRSTGAGSASGPAGGGGVTLDVEAFLADRGPAVARILALLEATAARAPRLGCFGLHEWAMVYRSGPDARRHERWPLRLGQAGTDAVVARSGVRCTHFDAFRFFTDAARPLNEQPLNRAGQVGAEQPGCLHATMDLYKWAYKLGPATPSSLTAECFALAREVRQLDMRASPYDLRALGLEPVAIETPDGRAEYVTQQRGFTERGQVLRARLIEHCRRLVTMTDRLPIPSP